MEKLHRLFLTNLNNNLASPIFDRAKDHLSINKGTLKTPGLINFFEAGPQWDSPIHITILTCQKKQVKTVI